MVGPLVGVSATTSETLVACVVGGDAYVPVIVSPTVPVAVVVVVATVRVEVPPAMTGAGANAPVAPEGNPVTDRLTSCAVPDVTCVLTAYVVLDPLTTV
jgi:hypothetical protein